MSVKPPVMIEEILKRLPHRYPFVMVDRVLEYEIGSSIKALKNVTINEPFFQGHFPGLPVMPGVLQLEAMAQAGAVLLSLGQDNLQDKVFLFTGVNNAKFRRPGVPGDQIILTCTDMRGKMNLWRMNGKVTVDGELCAQAELTAAVVDKQKV